MKKASKILITIVAVLGLTAGTASLVSANSGWGGGHCDRSGQMQHQGGMRGGQFFRGGNMEEKMNERLNYMKYQLRITEVQEPAWNELEAVIKEKGTKMAQGVRKGGFKQQMPVTERVAFIRTNTEHMNKMADSIEKLYSQLSPEQQQIADQMRPLSRMR